MASAAGVRSGGLSALGPQNLNIETGIGAVRDYNTSPPAAAELKKELRPE